MRASHDWPQGDRGWRMKTPAYSIAALANATGNNRPCGGERLTDGAFRADTGDEP